MHPYLLVDDVCLTSVKGFSQTKYYDCHNPKNTCLESSLLHFDEGPCEKLFDAVPSLCIGTLNRNVSLSTKRFTEWMILNLGKSHGLVDLPVDAWRSFICIEPVILPSPNKLSPGAVLIGEMRVALL